VRPADDDDVVTEMDSLLDQMQCQGGRYDAGTAVAVDVELGPRGWPVPGGDDECVGGHDAALFADREQSITLPADHLGAGTEPDAVVEGLADEVAVLVILPVLAARNG
jgi:hypothetical protein